jgi:hypothetical protein
MWNSAADKDGLLGSRFDNYGDASLPASLGEKTLTLTVTPNSQTVTTLAPHRAPTDDKARSALHTWLIFDALLASSSSIRFRVIRVQDVVA